MYCGMASVHSPLRTCPWAPCRCYIWQQEANSMMRRDVSGLCPIEMKRENGKGAKGIVLWALQESSTDFRNSMPGEVFLFGKQKASTVGAPGSRTSLHQCLSVSQPWPTSLCWSGLNFNWLCPSLISCHLFLEVCKIVKRNSSRK